MIDWRHWHNEPILIGGLVLLGWLWAVLAGPLRARLAPGEPFPRARAWRFYTALAIFYLAVGSPLDQIGERFLFSVHMLQHYILIYLVPLFFLSGLTAWMVDPWVGRPSVRRLMRFILHPSICLLVFALVVSLWHMPYLYEWALQDKVVHVIEHLMFFGAAQMLYFFLGVITLTPVFAYLTFSHDIVYPTYEYAPRVFADFSAADDQLLAGVSMQLVSVAVAMTAFGVAFFRWYRKSRTEDVK